MIIQLLGSAKEFAYNIEHTVRLFFPHEKIEIMEEEELKSDSSVTIKINKEESYNVVEVAVYSVEFSKFLVKKVSISNEKKELRQEVAGMIYSLLSQKTGKIPPWGTLIGVRPVRLVHQMLEQGFSKEYIRELLETKNYVQANKVELALSISERQQQLLASNKAKDFSLYISIPFCPTRCLYCSFVSHAIDRTMRLVPTYVELLCQEIVETAILAKELGLTLKTIYMGGGTPTTLEPQELSSILQTINDNFILSNIVEYTVEAGRPDTITREKLQVLLNYGVNRISINPQTMNNSILTEIGRKHTAEETLNAYSLAREIGIPIINMDLIAGLPRETLEGFQKGLEQVIALNPENITVHSLTVKRSSTLRASNDFSTTNEQLPRIIDTARKQLEENDYLPYYLYRQKGTVENLENIGYSRPNYESLYNIYSMEEVHSILAVGAGAVTKLFAPPNTLQRVYNFKFPYEYIDNFEEILSRKSKIRSFYERNY